MYAKAYHDQTSENQWQNENLKSSQRKWYITYRGTKVKMNTDVSSEPIQSRSGNDITEKLKA